VTDQIMVTEPKADKGSAPFEALLISTYELGHQPFGLASPATWLRDLGLSVNCLDLAVQQVDEPVVRRASFIGFYLPMHTATRLATTMLPRIRALNPTAHICCYGLYAPVNESLLRKLGADTVIGGEFEESMEALVRRLAGIDGEGAAQQPLPAGPVEVSGRTMLQIEPLIALPRLRFRVPDRSTLPGLSNYAFLKLPNGERRVVGYTEATRGCKHLCRHCPIVPVYGGHFRVVQRPVVLADIAAQVAAGAEHITFGDPDFFNGPAHALAVIRDLHERFPTLTYDVIIKVEHLIKHAEHVPMLRDTGCLFVTSAVESVDDQTLEFFDKRHTREQFIQVTQMFRELGLGLNPTFVTFNPWTTPDNYLDLLRLIAELGLVGNVSPIQYAIRLLIPSGSRLLELPEVQRLVEPFDETALAYPWHHPDPAVDKLFADVMEAVTQGMREEISRAENFARIWDIAARAYLAAGGSPAGAAAPASPSGVPGLAPIPHLSEPWYCCAEPTEEQLSPSL
jgi:radical SAM superfamily enzyme YgiQ (UPF0313 family)